ncbi:hypothetical protein ACWC09_26515 [Streptomyces sp. NPDC001617]
MNETTNVPQLTGDQLLELMVAGERRNRQRRRGETDELAPYAPCPVCRQPVAEQSVTLGTADEDDRVLTVQPCGHRTVYNLKVAQQMVLKAQQIVDAEEKSAMDGTAGLDKTRRYLRPVRAMPISDDPDGVHLAVYQWIPMFEEWATGPGLCGESMRQGALPEGTVVTCARCEEWRPKYERYLAPGYRLEDDDAEALRARLDRIRAEVRMLCGCCGDNRDRMDRIRRELGLKAEGDL